MKIFFEDGNFFEKNNEMNEGDKKNEFKINYKNFENFKIFNKEDNYNNLDSKKFNEFNEFEKIIIYLFIKINLNITQISVIFLIFKNYFFSDFKNFKKLLEKYNNSNYYYFYYCKNCNFMFKFKSKKLNFRCEKCFQTLNYFLYKSFIENLKFLITKKNMNDLNYYKSIKKSNGISDIFDSEIFLKLKENFFKK